MDADAPIISWILFLVGGGVGSLVTAVGVTRTMISKSDCEVKHEMSDTVIGTKLDAIKDAVSEMKKHQDRLYRDFYKPQIMGAKNENRH